MAGPIGGGAAAPGSGDEGGGSLRAALVVPWTGAVVIGPVRPGGERGEGGPVASAARLAQLGFEVGLPVPAGQRELLAQGRRRIVGATRGSRITVARIAVTRITAVRVRSLGVSAVVHPKLRSS